MLNPSAIAEQLRQILPHNLHGTIPELAETLAKLTNGQITPESAQAKVSNTQGIEQVINILRLFEQQTSTNSAALSLDNSQIGEVNIRDVAHNIINVYYHAAHQRDETTQAQITSANIEPLYIVANKPGIKRFDPLPASRLHYNSQPDRYRSGGNKVGAVNDGQLYHYLLPLDCPRVSIYALPTSSHNDIEQYFGLSSSKSFIAIQWGSLAELPQTKLYLYEVPKATFSEVDSMPGHFNSHEPVTPIRMREIDNIIEELMQYDVELRVTSSLMKLHQAVRSSTLRYLGICLRAAS